MPHISRNIFGLFLAISLLIGFFVNSPFVQAQTPTNWQPPQRIPGLVGTIQSQYPIFVTDTTGKIHLLHSQWVDGIFSIVYSQWTIGVGWTQPVDIYRPSWKQARITGAFLDDNANLFALFFGGDELGANMYIIHAPIAEAGKSTAWSNPLMIGPNAISPTTATLSSDGKGKIVMVYSGNIEDNGLYSVFSTDFGETWSQPKLVFPTGGDSLWVVQLKLFQSADKRIHAVWGLGDITGNSRAVYYARFDPIQMTWSKPKVLAEKIDFEANTPSIIEYKGSLMVIFHNAFPTTRWMTRSFDGGETWTAPIHLFAQVGTNGPAALVIDSNDTLHMFFGNRVGNPPVHGLWHSTWLGDSWSIPEAVISGPQVLVGENGEEGFDPSFAQTVLSKGNLLLLVWRHDSVAGPINIWFSYRYLDSPQLSTSSIPTLIPSASPSPIPVTPTVTPTPYGAFTGEPIPQSGNTINTILMTAIGPAVVVIIAMIFYVQRKHR